MDAELAPGLVLGVDVGGTFTDVVAVEAATGRLRLALKLLSTPGDPAEAVLAGVDRVRAALGGDVEALMHGTTVGTNALIEKRGARTALVATAGFRDVIELRRQARPLLFDLAQRVSQPLVPRDLRIEVAERLAADGSVVTPLQDGAIAAAAATLAAAKVEAVAICLLHSYADDRHERAMEAALRDALPGAFVTCSSDVCREYREFERFSTATVNAYIGPPVRRYLQRLEGALSSRGIARFGIVKSNGGITGAANAARHPVHLIESGPAAGLIAAASLARGEGELNLIAFDMGGTTAKAGVVLDGKPRLTPEFVADRFVDGVDRGGYPLRSPALDVIEIGAGGGSIAAIDSGGVLKVGPRSAGADPGPACYGRGGTLPTVTDAHLVAGTLDPGSYGPDALRLDEELARRAIADHVARPLGWDVERAAEAILAIATASMVEMVRLATVRRGLDPRDFALLAYGGAGPMHAAAIAREVGCRTMLLPPSPGLFSALGALLGGARHDIVRTMLQPADALDPATLAATLDAMGRELAARLESDRELSPGGAATHAVALDMRFKGQLFEIAVPIDRGALPSGAEAARAFRKAYAAEYGYDLTEASVEIVSLRSSASLNPWQAALPERQRSVPLSPMRRSVLDGGRRIDMPVVARESLADGAPLAGPALIVEASTTLRVLAGQRAVMRKSGVLAVSEESRDA
ncbi:MAG: hydantoinase/oxoprolinase family protein [Alphaproteobacteria bacterium]|nr:hydantoinase/oxoprolinase family protein [Alphaproteobacteria bacterium]